MLFLSIFLACGEKDTTDDSLDTGTSTEDANTSDENTDTNSNDDTNSSDTDTNSGDTDNPEEITPVEGSWTVEGPDLLAENNTCDDGEELIAPRAMTLSLDGSALSLVIEEAGEDPLNFSCTMTGNAFSCQDINIQNAIPMLPCTLTYTHQLQGSFSNSQSLTGTYVIKHSDDGDTGCTESNLEYTPPCEQVGTLTATAD